MGEGEAGWPLDVLSTSHISIFSCHFPVTFNKPVEVDILNKTGHTRRSADILIQLLVVSEQALGVLSGIKKPHYLVLLGQLWMPLPEIN